MLFDVIPGFISHRYEEATAFFPEGRNENSPEWSKAETGDGIPT
jgi:hypothetical protein